MTLPEQRNTDEPSAPTGHRDDHWIRPEDLKHIAEEKEKASIDRLMEQMKQHTEEQRELYRAFTERHVHPEVRRRFSEAVRRAAERGEREIELLRFPSDWCTDRGRAINNDEKEWASTLTGFAKECYETYDTSLRPLGYKMRARILDYPDGMPGNVGLFVSW